MEPPTPEVVSSADAGNERPPREAKSGPPSLGEWEDFLGAIVLRGITEAYLQLVLFRVVDETELTEREQNLIKLTKAELKDMAAPMASYANKNKFARKHGRAVIAAAGSIESLIDLFIWMKRVNKITRAHAKTAPRKDEVTNARNVPAQNGSASGIQSVIVNRGTG